MRRALNRAACGRRIGMCGYTSVPKDGRTCFCCRLLSQIILKLDWCTSDVTLYDKARRKLSDKNNLPTSVSALDFCLQNLHDTVFLYPWMYWTGPSLDSSHLGSRQSPIAIFLASRGKFWVKIKTTFVTSAILIPRAHKWHVLTRDHTVLPATHTFIHEWNEPSCL